MYNDPSTLWLQRVEHVHFFCVQSTNVDKFANKFLCSHSEAILQRKFKEEVF